MKLLSFLIILSSFLFTNAQTWSDDLAQIFYDKCSKCHNISGVGPFPLTTFAEASSMASVIYDAVNLNEMPPWPPDNNYQSYVHDRSLSASEKSTMLNWLTNGTPEGDPANTPPPPIFNPGSILGPGDLEVQIPTYMSKALSNGDDYVCFALPSNLATSRTIKSVEIIPGNPEIVHHALIYLDPSGGCVTDTIGGDCAGPTSPTASLVMGYTPGSSPMTLPSASPLKSGIQFPANSQVVFAMHYPEGSYGQYDSTKVIFHFYPPGETGIRPVYTAPIIQNWSFMLPADQITSVNAQFPSGSGGLTTDYSMLSVFPHMHLLGQEMRVFGIKPNSDTLKMINIPHWDFEWQDFFFYEYIQHAETGTILKAEAKYDNTSANIHNPNNPPINVFPGLNTSDEMFLVYMHYMDYQVGDELINLDSLMNPSSGGGTGALNELGQDELFEVYPNPFQDELNFYSNELTPGDNISMSLYDSQGTLVKKLTQNYVVKQKELHLVWNGKNSFGKNVSPGLYFVSLNINGTFRHQRLIKR